MIHCNSKVLALAIFWLAACVADTAKAQGDAPLVWQVDLVGGGRLVGPVKTATIQLETEFGRLGVPISRLTEFTPGFVSHPEELRRVDASIEQLAADKAHVREAAERALHEFGPRAAELLQAAGRDADLERRQRAEDSRTVPQ
jgi:hypothetical protein